MVKRWRAGTDRRLTTTERLRLVRGHGRFVGPRTVDVNGDRYEATNVVINVGARPSVPALAGPRRRGPPDEHERAFELTGAAAALTLDPGRRLRRACELGQLFRRLGAEVALVAPSARLLPHARTRPRPRRSRACFALRGSSSRSAVAPSRSRARAATSSCASKVARRSRGSHLLVATGRTPNTRRSRLRGGQRNARRPGPRRRRRALRDLGARRVRRGRLRARAAVHARVVGRSPRALRSAPRGAPRRRPHRSRRALHGVHGSAGRGRRAHGGGGSRAQPPDRGSRPCRSATSRARSRPTRRRAS